MFAEVAISGGGIGGLLTAAAFGSAGRGVFCFDPLPFNTEPNPGGDIRATALLLPCRTLLSDIEIWDRLEPFLTTLKTLRIAIFAPGSYEADSTLDFHSNEIGLECFGWSVPNTKLKELLVGRISTFPNVELRPGVSAQAVATRNDQAFVELSGTVAHSHRIQKMAEVDDAAPNGGLGCNNPGFGVCA